MKSRFTTTINQLTIVVMLCCIASPTLAERSNFLDLQLATEDYAPMNYFERGVFKGISIDLLNLIWQREGITNEPEIVLYPWARAYFELKNEPNFVLFAVARIPSRETLFEWACPIVDTHYILLAKKSSKIKINSIDDLENYTIGTVRSDVSEQALLSILNEPFNILSNTSMRPNLELMDKGRVHMIAYDKLGANQMLSNAGRNPEDFESVYTVADSQTCFAFNKQVDPDIITRFRQHLQAIVEDGQYQEILSRYYGPKQLLN
ncbi:substrate-binding periplasmic protein [Planctobacterium marinum]|uniref:Solute-binding protein family 3/N-terminal domain-containing protein n=1 Tax=Planctobacterium marinum TaxID=1631968 RepID=A0AA48KWD5_9ALTE|nr:hypothetical protein MACH26_39560 [Planctobacterium marinum]